MRKLVEHIAGVIAVLLVIAAGAAGFAQFASERKLHRVVNVEATPITMKDLSIVGWR